MKKWQIETSETSEISEISEILFRVFLFPSFRLWLQAKIENLDLKISENNFRDFRDYRGFQVFDLAKVARFARNFCISQQQTCNLRTRTKSLNLVFNIFHYLLKYSYSRKPELFWYIAMIWFKALTKFNGIIFQFCYIFNLK